MMWTEKNIFEPSGCLSAKAFEALVSDSLPAKVKEVAEAHVATCEFCSDALEGYRTMQGYSSFAELNAKENLKFKTLIQSQRKVVPIYKRRWVQVAAAASVIIIVGMLFLLKPLTRKAELAQQVQEKQMNDETTERASEPKAIAADSTEINEQKEQIAEVSSKPIARQPKATVQQHLEPVPKEVIVTTENEANSPDYAPIAATQSPAGKENITLADTLRTDNAMLAYEDKDKVNAGYYDEKSAPANSMRSMKAPTAAKKASADKEYFEKPVNPPKFGTGTVSDFQKYIQTQMGEVIDTTKATKVTIRFTVNEKGEISQARITKGENAPRAKDVLDKILTSPRWTPAMKENTAVPAELEIGIWVP